jgi:hypothetical protein
MAINKQQLAIINPFPETIDTANASGQPFGETYPYNSPRCRWIMDGIYLYHEKYGSFPEIGRTLSATGPLTGSSNNIPNNLITRSDALAFCALRPQLSKVTRSRAVEPVLIPENNPINPPDLDLGGAMVISLVTEAESITSLVGVMSNIMTRPNGLSILTVTSPSSLEPDNQSSIETVGPTISDWTQLGSISPPISVQRRQQILESFGVTQPPVSPDPETVESTAATPKNIKTGINPFVHATASDPNPPVYWSISDKNWYFVQRTNSLDINEYLQTGPDEAPEDVEQRINNFKRQALQKILEAAGRYSAANATSEELLGQINFKSQYGDPNMPVPQNTIPEDHPNGSDAQRTPLPPPRRWILSATLPKSITDNLTAPGTSAAEDEGLTQLQMTRLTLDGFKAERQVAFTVGSMRTKIKQAVKVIEFYDNEIQKSQTPPENMDGLDLADEARRLAAFDAAVDRFFVLNKITPDSDTAIEFKFDAKFKLLNIVVGGYIYYKGTGNKLSDPGTPQVEGAPPPPPEENAFLSINQTTFGYVFFTPDISALTPWRNGSRSLPWIEFVQNFTYPLVTIYPKEIGASQRVSWKNNPKKDKAAKNTWVTVQQSIQQFNKRMNQDKPLYNTIRSAVASSTGNCDTGQAAFLRDGLKVYKLIAKKTRTRDLVQGAVTIIRDSLISDKQARFNISRTQFAADNPDQVIQLIEREVNEELFCILGLLGDAVDAQILSPGGATPSQRRLIRDSFKPSKGIKFSKSPTRDFIKPWRKKVKQLLINYIQQLILGIFTDLLSAALGCGPEEASDKPTPDLKVSLQTATYGKIQINELVDAQGGIDLPRIALDMGLINRISTTNEDDESVVEENPPKLDQVRQFNQDTSDILLDGETIALLRGNADGNILGRIDEMVNKGPADLDLLTPDERKNPIKVSEVQHSLGSNDVKYATLGITPSTIEKYFTSLGKAIEGELEGLLDPLDPNSAYCRMMDPYVPRPIEVGLSQYQIETQLDNQINSKIDQIKSLCDLLGGGFSFQTDIDGFSASLEKPAFYTAFLALISKFSNAAAKAASEALLEQSSAPAANQAELAPEDTELFQAASQFFGSKKHKLRVKQSTLVAPLGEEPRHAEWYIGDNELGIFSFIFLGDNEVGLYYASPDNIDNPGFIGSFNLSDSNNPTDNNSPYRISTGAGRPNLQLFNWGYPPTGTDGTSQAISSMLNDSTSMALGGLSPANPTPYKFGVLAQNTAENIPQQLQNFYLTGRAKVSLRRITTSLVEPCFSVAPDPTCPDPREQDIARAALSGIQNRLTNFVLNSGPLHRVYFGWYTPDTIKMISSYLYYKFEKDMREKGIFDIYVSALPYLEKYMPNPPQDGIIFPEDRAEIPDIAFNLASVEGTQQKFEYIIQQCLKQMFKRIKKAKGPQKMASNIFEDPQLKGWYDSLANYCRLGIYEPLLRLDDDQAIYEEYDKTSQSFSTLPISQGVTNPATSEQLFNSEIFLKYIPVPLLIGANLIFYDKAVNFLRKFPSFNFFAGQRVALADDALISSINDQNYNVFSNPYDGYPAVIRGNVYYSKEGIEKRIDFLQGVRERIFALERMFGPLGSIDDNYQLEAYIQRDNSEFSRPLRNDENQFIRLEQNLGQFRTSMNSIYAQSSVWTGFRSLYPTVESQKLLIRAALEYNHMGSYDNLAIAMGNPNAQRGSMQLSPWAWYERARLLGWAPDDPDESLLGVFLTSEDLPNLDNESRRRSGWLRRTTLSQNTWTPGELDINDISRYLGEVITDLEWDGVGNKIWSSTAIVFLSVGWIAGAWLDSILTLFENIFASDVYRDPDETDSLRYVRDLKNIPIIADGQVIYRDIALVDELYDCAKRIPAHQNTLEKIAINHLYFELASKTRDFKPLVNAKDSFNEINELKDFIAVDTEPRSSFPIYVEIEDEQVAYFSVEDMQEEVDRLKASFLYRSIESLNNYFEERDDFIREAGIYEANAEGERGADEELQAISLGFSMMLSYANFATNGSTGSQLLQSIQDGIGARASAFLRLVGLDTDNIVEELIEDQLVEWVEDLASISIYGYQDIGSDLNAFATGQVLALKNRLIGTRATQSTVRFRGQDYTLRGSYYGNRGLLDVVDDIQEVFDSIRDSGIQITGDVSYDSRKSRLLGDIERLESAIYQYRFDE